MHDFAGLQLRQGTRYKTRKFPYVHFYVFRNSGVVHSLALQSHTFVVLLRTYTRMTLPDFNSDRARDTRNEIFVISAITVPYVHFFVFRYSGVVRSLALQSHKFGVLLRTCTFMTLPDFNSDRARHTRNKSFAISASTVPYVHFFVFRYSGVVNSLTLQSHLFVALLRTYTRMTLPDFNSNKARDMRNENFVVSAIAVPYVHFTFSVTRAWYTLWRCNHTSL